MTGGYCFDTYNKECGYFLPPLGTFMTSNITDDKYFANVTKYSQIFGSIQQFVLSFELPKWTLKL